MRDEQRVAVRAAMGAAGKRRPAVARELAATFGVSVATIYRAASSGAKRQRQASKPHYRGWVRVAVQRAHAAPKPVPLDLAIRACVQAGDLPAEALAMPLSTARRIRREQGWSARPARTSRLVADWSMQALQIDGSTSDRLVAVEPRDDGDWLLRLHRPPTTAGGYKNKPLAGHRQRVTVYGAWEMCSGLALARYAVALGENALDAARFLCWALAGGHPRGMPLRGVPDTLWSDQGPLVRSGAARDLLERLDVEIVHGPPYAKTRMGGVERIWRTLWERFERSLFLLGRDTITLSEANERLLAYCTEQSARPARRSRPDGGVWTRAECWRGMLAKRPAPLRELPADPLRTLAREARRRIDRAGILRWDGVEYECPDWHDRWVTVRLALAGDADAVTVEDEATGERRACARWTPRPHGQVPAAAATPLDDLLAEEREFAPADLWAPDGDQQQGNVVPLPARTAPARPLADPLDADALADGEDPMQVFAEICARPLSPASRRAVEAAVARAGRSRSAIQSIAREIAGLEDVG